jgi:hypothetical protein
LPLIVVSGEERVKCEAKLDTGADFCLFSREVADGLHLEVESGQRQRFGTITGSFYGYGHEVMLITFDIAFEATVFFVAEYGLPRNFLGRHGWLQQVRLGLVDYDAEIFLSHYQE